MTTPLARSSPSPSLLFVAAEQRGHDFLRAWISPSDPPLFCCVLAHTDTCLVPGISAAGATLAVRPATPAADAEVVTHGRPFCVPVIPSNPLGPPGPAGITRAAVQLAQLPVHWVAAGLRVWPAVSFERIDCAPGGSIQHGGAVPEAARLYAEGHAIGTRLAAAHPRLVLGESVPGGTTTALALLLALGIPARGRVSGSVTDNAHPLKEGLARAALAAAGLGTGDGRSDPLASAAAVGDPMQPIAAGLAVGAARAGALVLLAGGSQMIAVAALMAAVEGGDALGSVAVGTTRWVAQDPAADVPALARSVSPHLPLIAANLNFSRAGHLALRGYERFLVKEGVGAGGACIAALVSGAPVERLHLAIDAAYDALAAPRPS